MGFLGAFLGEVVGKEASKAVRQKLDEHKAMKVARAEAEFELDSYIGGVFRLPEGFCEGANGKVWRARERNGRYILLRRSNGHICEEWFYIDDILEYYEDI